jgi:hypothetical protein
MGGTLAKADNTQLAAAVLALLARLNTWTVRQTFSDGVTAPVLNPPAGSGLDIGANDDNTTRLWRNGVQGLSLDADAQVDDLLALHVGSATHINGVREPLFPDWAAPRSYVDTAVSDRPGLLGLSVSSSSWNVLSSGSWNDVISVEVTTHGRPVLLMLVPDGGAGGASVSCSGSSPATIKFRRASTDVLLAPMPPNAAPNPPGGYAQIDTPPAGTHMYTVSVIGPVSSGTIAVVFCKLAVIEL